MMYTINKIEYKTKIEYINKIRDIVANYLKDNYGLYRYYKTLSIADIFENDKYIRVYTKIKFSTFSDLFQIEKETGEIYPLHMPNSYKYNVSDFDLVYNSYIKGTVQTGEDTLIKLLKDYGASEEEIKNFIEDLFIRSVSDEDQLIKILDDKPYKKEEIVNSITSEDNDLK